MFPTLVIQNLQTIPVTIGITIVLLARHRLDSDTSPEQRASELCRNKNAPPQDEIQSTLTRQLTHGSHLHLAVNLLALWYLSSIERRVGSVRYFTAVCFLLFAVSILDLSVHHSAVSNKVQCSVGFSGVLLGLATWNLFQMHNNVMSFEFLIGAALLWSQNSLFVRNASYFGHFSGVSAGMAWSVLDREVRQ